MCIFTSWHFAALLLAAIQAANAKDTQQHWQAVFQDSTTSVFARDCTALSSLKLENTTITNAYSQSKGIKVPTPMPCSAPLGDITTSADVCRVQGYVNTTSESLVTFEAWLPNTWYGRFMGLGNGGLGGCIDWGSLDYTTHLHFAAIATNNGHDGWSGNAFLNHPEVINDFAYRAIHTEAVIGKQLVEAYYGKKPAKSYFLGCSTGGRQAIGSATRYPDDFDGLLGAAPAVNFNVLLGSHALLARHIDAPNANVANGFITPDLWQLVSQEIMQQCDSLDGVADGIISEPDDCNPGFEHLICRGGDLDGCLNNAQLQALQKIYSPIIGANGEELHPRFDPGAESNGAWQSLFDGNFSSMGQDWWRYAVHNNSEFRMNDFSVSDIEYGDFINPGGIATWSGDLAAFRDRGGKFLTFHGRSDHMIQSGNSKRLYKLISSKLSMDDLDDFYRFFSIPGMQHCGDGPGAIHFGQGLSYGNHKNTLNDTSHNILLALVDWVEGGVAPEVIIGTGKNGTSRMHCRYPYESYWDGFEWGCRHRHAME